MFNCVVLLPVFLRPGSTGKLYFSVPVEPAKLYFDTKTLVKNLAKNLVKNLAKNPGMPTMY